MSDQLREVCEGFTAGIGTLTRVGGTLERSGTVYGCFSGLPVPPFNAIHAWYDDDDVEADVRALVARGEERNLPMAISVQVGSPQEPTVEAVAGQLGFAPAGEPQAAMVLVDSDVPPLPDGVACSSPANAEDLGVIADLMAVFGLPGDIARAAAHPDTLDWDDLEWFTLWADDAAVATSMLIQVGEVANVFNVAVPVEHRRKGFGAAATWEVVRRGQQRGATRTQLVASAMGEPVYADMGFDVVGRIRTFMRS